VTDIDRLNQAAAAQKTAFENTIADKDTTIAAKTKDYNDLQASAAAREQERVNADLSAIIHGSGAAP